MDGFDFSELTNFKKELMEEIVQDLPKDAQKFLDKEKRKFLKEVKKTAKTNVGKKTGNYYKSLKAGKTHYNKKSKDVYTKVYADEKIAPHAHLIENGHIIKGRDGKEKGFALGKHIFKSPKCLFNRLMKMTQTNF